MTGLAWAADQVFFGRATAMRFDLEAARSSDCPPPRKPSVVPLHLEEDARRNVVLISVDALRADVIGLRAGEREVAPNLTRLAQQGVYFRRAIAPYPATVLSLGSAVTGLAPSEILMAPRPPRNVFTRARERFERRLVVLPSNSWFRQPIIDALFVQEAEVQHIDGARQKTDVAVAALTHAQKEGERAFLWVHYYEPHAPYREHAGFAYGESKREQYLSEVSFVDAEIGRLLAFLEEGGWLEDTLVLFFADHGEALGERSYFGHHVYLDAFLIDVPLILRAPGLASRMEDAVVSVSDVAPTVLHFAGLPLTPDEAAHSLLGRDFDLGFRIAEAFPVRVRKLFDIVNQPVNDLESLRARVDAIHRELKRYEPKVSLVTSAWRLIVHRDTGLFSLHPRAGPSEFNENVAPKHPQEVQVLSERLERWHSETARRLYCAVAASGDAPEPPEGDSAR